MTTDFPDLEILANGASGIEIRAKLSQNYDLREFTLNSNPQPIFISPWMQWEPPAMNDERQRLAFEIARRAMTYGALLKQVDDLKKNLEHMRNREDRFRNQINTAFDMWKADRKRFGLPEDFSDITVWPPEMMGQYI